MDPHVMVADLPPCTQDALRAYLLERFPGSPEVVDILFHISTTKREHLRVKELCETVEAVRLAGKAISEARKASRAQKRATKLEECNGGCDLPATAPAATAKPLSTPTAILDLACGHGLAGVLLAYRFGDIPVVCLDRVRRACFDTYVEAFEALGEKLAGRRAVLGNLTFVEGDLEAARPLCPRGAFLVSVHGCNEVSPRVVEMSKECGGGCAVVPCCVRGSIFGLNTRSNNGRWTIPDATQYSLQVGFLAGRFGARRVAAIDNRITDKNLCIIGTFWDRAV
jgi:SAM-dependent methyltransferase